MIGKIFTSKSFLIGTWVVAGIVLLLLAFFTGVRFGFMKSFAACKYHESYRKNFEGFGQKQQQRDGFMPDDPFGAHGVIGQVISLRNGELILKERTGLEKIITTTASTTIMKQRNAIRLEDISIDEFIMVVGEVGDDGKTVAKFMRVLPALPGMIE